MSRRNPRIRRAIASIGNLDGIRYLAPEIQLFYRAGKPRDKDQIDFDAVLPLLTPAQRRWLREAVTDTYGVHPWLNRLGDHCAPLGSLRADVKRGVVRMSADHRSQRARSPHRGRRPLPNYAISPHEDDQTEASV